MARTLRVQSRSIWHVITGSLSDPPSQARPWKPLNCHFFGCSLCCCALQQPYLSTSKQDHTNSQLLIRFDAATVQQQPRFKTLCDSHSASVFACMRVRLCAILTTIWTIPTRTSEFQLRTCAVQTAIQQQLYNSSEPHNWLIHIDRNGCVAPTCDTPGIPSQPHPEGEL